MTDYNKLTVANLRQLLKDRGIPSTGLTRKAQIIEKLEEDDTQGNDVPTDAQVEVEAEPTEQADVVHEARDEAATSDGGLRIHVIDAPEAYVNIEPAGVEETTPVPENAPEPVLQTAKEASPALDAVVQEPEKSSKPTLEPPPELAVESPQQNAPQTQVQDFAMPDNTPSPAPNEKPSIEKPELLPIPEQSADSSSVEPSRMNSEELEQDTRKRKRRSHSPSVSTVDFRAKKPRPSDEVVPNAHLKEDGDVVISQSQPEASIPAGSKDQDINGISKTEEDDVQKQESDFVGATPTASAVPELPEPEEPAVSVLQDSKSAPSEKKEKGDRYKTVFQSGAPLSTVDATPSADDRPIAPARHPATPAIYIRDLMRPLRPDPLRTHLISLASPPTSSPDPTILKSLFLDSMRSHALVLFSSTTAASRVRASLHGSVWPPEGQRKALSVDFIPEDKVEDWIREEEEHIIAEKEGRLSGRTIPSKRFEVVYLENGDGSVEAVFQEVGASAHFSAPKGPRGSIAERRPSEQVREAKAAPTIDPDVKEDLGKSFKTLDQLFSSTEAKPKLYYLPVSDDISERRLDELDAETSRDWRPEDRVRGRGQGRLDQKMRFSFDGDDRLVEVGGDFGPWADDSFGEGRGGFFRGRGGRGGFRSDRGEFRGGYGGRGSWRGA